MIDNNILLNNPLIPPGYYFSKIKSIETEPSDFIFPKILIKLQLHKKYELENNIFHAILFPTENSYYHYKNFFNSFMLGQDTDNLEKAIGMWGSVKITNSEFQELEYSVVKFVYNPIEIMIESFKIWKEDNR